MAPNTVCDVGCGAGEVLKQLQEKLDRQCVFLGYDISPQAIELAKTRTGEKIHFELGDAGQDTDKVFDLILALDVIEHLPDYFAFLRTLKARGRGKIFHIPLDLSAQTVLRKNGLVKRREMYAHLHYFTQETALQTWRRACLGVSAFWC